MKTIRKAVSEFSFCLDLDAAACAREHFCEWNAQGGDVCGIDEEIFMQRVAGPHQQHPLIRMIMYQNHCSQRSMEQCNADSICQFDAGRRLCDINRQFVLKIMMANPRLWLQMELVGQTVEPDARCFHTDAKDCCDRVRDATQCKRASCEMVEGICRYDQSPALKPFRRFGQRQIPPDRTTQLELAIREFCRTSWMQSTFHRNPYRKDAHMSPAGCPKPCVHTTFHGKESAMPSSCTSPKISDAILQERDRPDSSWVVKLFTIIQTVQWAPDQYCRHIPPDQCRKSRPLCTEADALQGVHAWVHPLIRNASSSHSASPSFHWASPGVKGALERAAHAVASGHGKEFMEEFLSDHPDAVDEIASTLSSRIKTLWDEATTTAPATTLPIRSRIIALAHEDMMTTPSPVYEDLVTTPKASEAMSIWVDGHTVQLEPGGKMGWFLLVALLFAICSAGTLALTLGVFCWRSRVLKSRRDLEGALLVSDSDMTEYIASEIVCDAEALG